MFVTLTASFLTMLVDIWLQRPLCSILMRIHSTQPVVVGGNCQVITRETGCCLPLISLVGMLNCIVIWGKGIGLCLVSTNTRLCLLNCKTVIEPVKYFFTMKYSAKLKSPLSILSVAVAVAFSNWPSASQCWKKDRRFWSYWWGLLFHLVHFGCPDGIVICSRVN